MESANYDGADDYKDVKVPPFPIAVAATNKNGGVK